MNKNLKEQVGRRVVSKKIIIYCAHTLFSQNKNVCIYLAGFIKWHKESLMSFHVILYMYAYKSCIKKMIMILLPLPVAKNKR